MIDVVTRCDLTSRNTLRLPGVAERVAFVATVDDARRVVEREHGRLHVLGGGSNVVVHARVPGCVVVPRLDGIRAADDGDTTLVRAGAGVRWHDLVRFCIGRGLCGIENLALIPGLVGAAPIQNIGAYGVELDTVFERLTAVSCTDGTVHDFDRTACDFGYRDSRFRRAVGDRYLIVEITLRLSGRFARNVAYPDVGAEVRRLGRAARAADVAEAVIRVRRRKLPDPRRVPNAGSFFKNPVVSRVQYDALRARLPGLLGFDAPGGVKIPAARLIDAAGWKGKRLGRAGVWPRQALVLVNLGGARAPDVLALAAAIVDDVAVRYGVALELEPQILGSPD